MIFPSQCQSFCDDLLNRNKKSFDELLSNDEKEKEDEIDEFFDFDSQSQMDTQFSSQYSSQDSQKIYLSPRILF